MIRTQIYLPEEQIDYLRLLAVEQGSTLSEQIRSSIDIAHPSKKAKKETYVQKLLKIKGDWFDYDEYKKNKGELGSGIGKYNL